MRIPLTINGVDFTQWIAEDGIAISPIERIRKSVVVLSGTEHRTTIEKDKIDVILLDLPDDEYKKAVNAIKASYPAVVTYGNQAGQIRSSVLFYPTSPSAKAKKVVGNTTYWSGISFSLEEK